MKLGNLSKTYITFSQDGSLKISVNELSIKAPFGGANLLHQTAPRANTIVKHYVKTDTAETYTTTDKGTTPSKKSTEEYHLVNYDPTDDKKIKYTWTINAWEISSTDEAGTVLKDRNDYNTWDHNNDYKTNNIVRRHYNLWKAIANIEAHKNPPGNNDTWNPYISVSDDDSKKDVINIGYP